MAAKTQVQTPAAVAPALAWRFAYLLLAAAVLLADRFTKILIETSLPLYDARPVIPGFFQIIHVTNEGIAFGLFADSPGAFKTYILIALSTAALAAVLYMLWTADPASSLQATGLALILGGAAGNLYDRIRYGRVVDFLDVYVGDYHWPTFNLADSAIVIGGGLLLLHLARRPQPHR